MRSTSDELLKAHLIEAYEADQNRSKMGRLRKQRDTIFELQKGGMSLQKILVVLNAEKNPEESLSMKTFRGYLHLLRKEKSSQQKDVAATSMLRSTQTPLANTNLKPKKTVTKVAAKQITSDEVRESFNKQKDFSKYNTD